MPSYLVQGNIKNKVLIDDDVFDALFNSLKDEEETPMTLSTSSDTSEEDFNWRRNPDGSYNKCPNDPDYFKKYYKEKLKQPIECSLCGKKLADKTNLSRHQKTKTCIKHRNVN